LVRSTRWREENLVQSGRQQTLFRGRLVPHWQQPQNGWPSVTYPGVEPNSPDAVASVAEESVGAFPMCYSDYLPAPQEILRAAGLQMFVLQDGPRRRRRLVRPSLLGLPGARLWYLEYRYEAQVRLRSQNFVLKAGLMIQYMYCGYSVRPCSFMIHFLISDFMSSLACW